MNNNYYISREISQSVVMTGVYYKHNHPGGISAVIQYWSKYIEDIRYYPSFKEGDILLKLWWCFYAYVCLFFVFLFDRRVQILHSHTAAGNDFRRTASFVNLAKMFGKKVIIHSHASMFKDYYGNSTPKRQSEIIATLNKADRLVVLSESWKEWFANIGVDKDKIIILHNITDYPDKIQVEKDFRKLKLLFLGEIGQRKGVYDLLKAVADHREEFKNRIEIKIGGNKQEEKLKKTISDNQLTDFVFFEGFVSGQKKKDLLNWADVYILPSYNEGLPISILEAMSYGMPIISTPVGGIPEVVNAENGVLVKPGNIDDIYNAISKYIGEKDLIVTQGVKSLKKSSTYLPDYVMSQLQECYLSLLS